MATFAGVVDLSKTNFQKAFLNLLIVTISTALVAIVTEEGFFRGWLWGSLVRRGIIESHVLIYTSIAFALWHISAVILDTRLQADAVSGSYLSYQRGSDRDRLGNVALDVGINHCCQL